MATPPILHIVRELVSQAVQQAQREGLLQLETTPEIQVERPAKAENGDFATSLPLRLARATRINPLELAESLIKYIPACDEIDRVDLYSCFPSAVQVAAQELGLSEERPLTVTGGLTFGGGPLNNYTMHGIARMGEVLREDPGSRGLCTANGGYLTKHAFGVYGTEPPEAGFRWESLQDAVDRLPRREAVVDHDGEATLESYTVRYDAGVPERAHAAFLLADGRRTWANSEDRELADEMTRSEFCGRAARIDGAGTFSVQ